MFGIVGMISGILLILIGGALVFVFPSAAPRYQPTEFSVLVIVMGFVMIIAGAVMIFV